MESINKTLKETRINAYLKEETRINAYLKEAKRFAKKFGVRLSKSQFGKLFGSSIYKPHQGEQEKARRRNQIERGILKI